MIVKHDCDLWRQCVTYNYVSFVMESIIVRYNEYYDHVFNTSSKSIDLERSQSSARLEISIRCQDRLDRVDLDGLCTIFEFEFDPDILHSSEFNPSESSDLRAARLGRPCLCGVLDALVS